MAEWAVENWIYKYYQKIKDGSIVVGRWVMAAYEILVKGLQDKAYFYDAKKADRAINWIEEHCLHTEGPLACTPLKLELWQKAFIASVFGVVNEEGLRQFREIVLVVSRKQGKSALCAAIARYIWQIDGGFGAKVYCVAPKLDQADIIYNNIWQMTLLDPEYQELKDSFAERDQHNKKVKDDAILPRHRQSDLFIPAQNAQVKKIAFASKTSDGYNPSVCFLDEFSSFSGDAGLKVFEVMKSGQGARPEGLLISVSTAGYVSDSLYDELIKRSTRFLMGDSKERKLLPLLYMIDDVAKWNDINELRKSNPNLGVSVSVDYLLEEIAAAEGSLSRRQEFLCKYCNIKQNSSLAWLSANAIEECFSGQPVKLEDHARRYCVVGVDLSRTTDLTAIVVLLEKDDKINVVAHFWLPAEKIEEATIRDNIPYDKFIKRGWLSPSGENFVDYKDVAAYIKDLVSIYKIYPLVIGYDRYSSTYLIDEVKASFKVDDVFQGTNLSGVISETEGRVLNGCKEGGFNFGDNDLLKAHLLSSAMKVDTDSGRRKLVKINAREHIDGVAALLDAMCVRQKWYAEIGEQLKNTKR